MKQQNKEIVYFVLMFVGFFLTTKIIRHFARRSKYNMECVNLCAGALYVLVMAVIYYMAKINSSSEGFWDVSPYAQCKGGPYMWQGDSETSDMCKAFAETPEGRCGISSYNCPSGYFGTPMAPFLYTPLSNDQWQDERTMDIPTCPCKDVGLCGMENQVA